MSLDDLDVCFLAWREAPAMLARHHAAVAEALGPGWRGTAVLAENAPPEPTSRAAREQLAARYPDATRVVLRMPGNLGYARAMDLALSACQGTYAALMNSDGRPAPDMLRRLVAALEDDPGALWAAPAVHGPGEAGQPPGEPHEEERLAGTALVVRRRPFLALGAFDPMYWFYSEDYDASDRAREAGWRLLRVPDAVFQHGKGGRSARGRLVREFWYAATDQALVWHREPSRARALARLARGRAGSLAAHARGRDLAALAGIGAATAGAPVSVLLAERRRRRPWNGPALERWLERHGPRVRREAS